MFGSGGAFEVLVDSFLALAAGFPGLWAVAAAAAEAAGEGEAALDDGNPTEDDVVDRVPDPTAPDVPLF